MNIHQCDHVGAQGGDSSERKILKAGPIWEISSPLYIMGSEVGEIIGRGDSKEAAEVDIVRQLREQADALWA